MSWASRKPLDTDTCPTPRVLEAYATQQLIGKRNEEVHLHLRHCATCLRRLAQLKEVPSADEIIEGPRPSSWWRRLLGKFRR